MRSAPQWFVNWRASLLLVAIILGLPLVAIAQSSAQVDPAKSVIWQLRSDRNWAQEIAAAKQAARSDALDPAVDISIRDLKERREYRFEQGKLYAKLLRVTEFRSAASLDNYGTQVVSVEPNSERLRFTGAVVLSPQGEITTFDPKTVQIQDTDSYDIFVDDYDVVLPLPNLEVGSVALLEYEKEIDLAARHTPWATYFSPQTERPKAVVELEVSWAAGVKPVWHNPFKPFECEETASKLFCRASNLPAVQLGDVVRYLDVLDYFTLAQDMTWGQVVALSREGFDAAVRNDDGVTKVFNRLIADVEGKEDTLAVLFEFVSREIRYVSSSEGSHGITPHAVSQTLGQRYGDCKDKSALLVALLSRAGIAAHPVLVSTDRFAAEPLVLPTMGYFNHMIVCGELPSRGRFCVDPTDLWTSSDSLSRWVQGAASLPLIADAQPELLPADDYTWTVKLDNELEFFADGRQVERQSRQFFGPYAAWMRSILSEKTKKERRRWALERYHQVVSNKAEPVFTFSGVEGQSSELTITSETDYANVFDATEELDYVETLAWLVDLIGDFENSNEVFPYQFSGMRVDSEVRIVLPKKWVLEQQGPKVDLVGQFGEFHQTVERSKSDSGQQLKVLTRVRMPRRSVAISELSLFKRYMDLVQAQSRVYFRAPLAKR